MINIRDLQTQRTVVVITGGSAQRLNAFTVLANGLILEFADAIRIEDLDALDETRGKTAQFNDK